MAHAGPSSQGDMQVNSQQVRGACASLCEADTKIMQNITQVRSTVNEVAEILPVLQDEEKMAAYREVQASFGQLLHKVRAHKGALEDLKATYQASMEDVDFHDQIQGLMQQRLQAQPYDPANDKDMADFLSIIGAEADRPAQEGDEDVLEVGNNHSWRNDTCPLSQKKVLELQDPVKDSLGYVYESANLLLYLNSQPPAGAKHPVAGVTLILRRSDILPADEVRRAKKRQRLQDAFGGGPSAGGTQAAPADEEDFLDVEG